MGGPGQGPGLWGSQGFLEKVAHRLRPEGWVEQLSLKGGPGGGAGLGEILRTVGDMVGVWGLGTPGWRCLGGHGTSGAEIQGGGGNRRQLWSQKGGLKL